MRSSLPVRLYFMCDAVLNGLDYIPESVAGSEVPKRNKHVRNKLVFRSTPEPDFFPASLESQIPADSFVRNLPDLVRELNLDSLYALYRPSGGVGYSPINYLCVVIFGITRGMREGAELEECCKYDIRYRYLMGGHTPDDRSFDRFIDRVAPMIDELMGEVLDLASSRGFAKGNEIAIDGTKIAANVSWWKYRKESAEPPSDPDARIMQSHGRQIVGYNAQIAIDTSDGLIVGADVSSSETDWHLAPEMMEVVSRQMGEYPARVIADSGYETPAAIAALEDLGIDTAFCVKDGLDETLCENADGDLVCMQGKKLILSGTHKIEDRVLDRYRPEGGCGGCPLKDRCTFKGKSLLVPPGDDPAAKFRNRARAQSAAFTGALLRRRRVERPFAQLKRHDRFTRFRRRGRNKVRVEFLLWAISYNLRRLFALNFAIIQTLIEWTLQYRKACSRLDPPNNKARNTYSLLMH